MDYKHQTGGIDLSVKEKTDFLNSIEIFANTNSDLLTSIAQLLKVAKVPKDSLIIREGDMGDCMYMVYAGKVLVHHNEHRIAEIGERSIFGELSLLNKEPRSASVSAITDCILLCYDQEDFYATMGERLDFTQGMINILIRRLRNQNSAVIDGLKKREKELEHLVEIRTADLNTEKKRLEHAFEEIKVQNENLARANLKINAQKDEIEIKSKHITQSVTYASRIQRAMLGQTENITKTFREQGGDAFVMFRPRDVVSGDFYWYGEVGRLKIVIAADCTGHGVPGAFMTMMGSALLNGIIGERHIIEPSLILHDLDTKVNAITQREGDMNTVQDGMDICILVFDFEKMLVRFAGAKNPLVLIRDGRAERIKGSRYPIGGGHFKSGKTFDSQALQMQHGDRYYIFTDGFQDQSGGDDGGEHGWGQKYLANRFRELLLQIHQMPMERQLARLDGEDFIMSVKQGSSPNDPRNGPKDLPASGEG